ncbi:MAG TPA: thioredoxin domain-containing protein, partial [Motilibacteraceae bacterium]|nr:thioredoxin domain-containing protein [Motilibacteraceae bacterium]
PAGEPFYCGTYFPPVPRHGMPSFPQLLQAVTDTWRNRRDEVDRVGAQVVERLSAPRTAGQGQPPTAEDLDAAVARLATEFDRARGGFGGAPKFPPSMVLEQLLRHAARTGDRQTASMAARTLEAMARGGIHDQLGGGFARYSVDAGWVVPHFEKMLYDNAQLLRAYLHWWRATGEPLARRTALTTADFLLRELRTPEGGFASALDADSEGEEGRFYVWTPAQLADVLGPDDGAWAAQLLEVTPEGTFEHGSSVLQLLAEPDDHERWEAVRSRLLAAREERVRPARDDKVVAAWNGLTVAALAETGALLERRDLLEAARAAAELLLRVHVVDGRLQRVSRDGVVGTPAAVLEDYADVAEGLLALHAVTGDARWLHEAGALLEVVLERFGDGRGGFYDTADDAETLVRRPQDPTDGVTPSGQSAAAGALLTYAALTGSQRHRAAAESALGVAALLARQAPRHAGWALAVAEALVDGPREVAVVGPAADPRTALLHRTALLGTAPGAVVSVGEPDGSGPAEVPLLADRPLLDGAPAAYVCRRFVCQRPVAEPEELAALVLARPDV